MEQILNSDIEGHIEDLDNKKHTPLPGKLAIKWPGPLLTAGQTELYVYTDHTGDDRDF